MPDDSSIRRDILEELKWIPAIDETNIEVEVSGGIVTLSGYVTDFNERLHAENAAKRVRGVAGVANEIKVCDESAELHTDTALARAAVDAIRADLPQVAERIKTVVSSAHVTLEGVVEWQWQRERLESTVRAVDGVSAVTNLIMINPSVVPDDIKQRIEAAFVRSAELDADQVSVDVREGEVVLRGKVSSLREKEEAQRTAWSAPGVRRVDNQIVVTH